MPPKSEIGVIVNSPFVPVYEYASDTSPVMDYVLEGEEVHILEDSSGAGFYFVCYDKWTRFGFINHNFMRRCENAS